MKRTLRLAFVLTLACAALATCSNLAYAQKVDLAFGVSTALGPSASSIGSGTPFPSLSGGAYPGFSGDVLFFHNLGIGAEVFWRASQGDYAGSGNGYRPLFYNFNAVYSKGIGSHASVELVAGIGALSTRYYCGINCFNPYTDTDYVSSNHFDADFGGGIKFYVRGGFFVRPEARFYLVNNDTGVSSDFNTNHFARVGVSIGYTFGRHSYF